jgi:hypothetical protein
MSEPFGGLADWASRMDAALDTVASSGQHYTVEPAAIREAIGHYRRLLREMEEDRPYIETIKNTMSPVEDGPSNTQARALRQFGTEIEAAHNKQMRYLRDETQKLQESLETYEKHEEATAEGLRGQM